MKKLLIALMATVSSTSLWAMDTADQQRLSDIQQQWATIQYETPEGKRADAFEQLAAKANAFSKERPTAAEAWIWSGIVTSSWAGAQGGLGALGKAKEARSDLEKALSIDPTALQGSAYASLAALYDRVPGWPVGFGDSDKADTLLKQALQINPNGIDNLYFWGDHLYRQKHYAEAKAALLKAQQAPARPDRASADKGRHKDIQALLVEIDKKLN